MNRNSRRTAVLLAFLMLTLGLLAACQRDRPAAEETQWETTPSPAANVTTTITSTTSVTTTVVGVPLATPGAVVVGTPLATPNSAIVVATPTLAAGEPVGPTFDYIVKPGDTLFVIAITYDTDVETIRRLNNLPDDSISVGQVLKVPGTDSTAPGQPGVVEPETTATPEPYVYTVQIGDSLSSIADDLGVDWRDVAVVNNIQPPDYTIFRGQKLEIPGVVPTPEPTAEVTTHVVQAGETLSSIAVQYGVTVQEIMQANQITNPDLLEIGQELVIP